LDSEIHSPVAADQGKSFAATVARRDFGQVKLCRFQSIISSSDSSEIPGPFPAPADSGASRSYGFLTFRIGLPGDLLLRTWKFALTVKREDGFLVSFMFADYLLHWTKRPFSRMRARWVVGKQGRSGRKLFPMRRDPLPATAVSCPYSLKSVRINAWSSTRMS
jgi:hypothetical protein